MLAAGASLNIYMGHGGTNFGWWSGANHTGSGFQPTVTSYDYDAPVSESGRVTTAFHAMREVIARYADPPAVALPADPPTIAPRSTAADRVAPLRSNLDRLSTVLATRRRRRWRTSVRRKGSCTIARP